MTVNLIPVNAGKVNSRDASTLRDGEVIEAKNAEYRPNDDAIWSVKGRNAFNSTAETDIVGGSFLQYDASVSTDWVLTYGSTDTEYRWSGAEALSGVFENISSDTETLWKSISPGAKVIDTVHYNNKFYVLNGVDRNRVIPAPSNRKAFTSFYQTRGAGGQTASDVPSTDGAVELHGMLSITETPTEWPNSAGSPVGARPDGSMFFIHEVGSPGFLNLTASDDAFVYWVEEQVRDPDDHTIILKKCPVEASAVFRVFGPLTNFVPNVAWEKVNEEATHAVLYRTGNIGEYPNGAVVHVAELLDPLTGSWWDASFAAGVRANEFALTDYSTGGTDNSLPTTGRLASTFGFYEANISGSTGYSGTVRSYQEMGNTYDVLAVVSSGVTQSVTKWGAPPVATTGDVFEDSLCLNDVSDKSLIRYSWADEPGSFPPLNFLRFETKEEDEVRAIRQINSYLVVLLRDSAWRVNSLPRPEDSGFETDRVKEQILGAFGCVGSRAAAAFSFGTGQRVAYVCPYGIMVTDGFTWDIGTDDVDWESEVQVDKLNQSVLINNPKKYRLEFYYTQAGGTKNGSCMYLHYHPSHVKVVNGNQRFKATWPVEVAADAATLVNIEGVQYVFTADPSGTWYVEGIGNTDADFEVRTGDLYLAGLGGQAEIKKFWAHHRAGAPNQTCTMGITERNEGDDDTEQTYEADWSRREPTQAGIASISEAHQLSVKNADSLGEVSVDYFAVDYPEKSETKEG